MPIPSDFERVDFQHKHMDQWRKFVAQLKPGIFKNGIDNWMYNMLDLMYEHVIKERDVYRQHIQAQFPNKRMKIEAGKISFR